RGSRGMTDKRTFAAKTHRQRAAAAEFILNLEGDYLVTIEQNRRTRSLAQNARYWVILTFIASQVKPNGQEYSPEVWHEYFKAKFLGKDTYLIDGDAILVPRSTTKLKVVEFIDYCTQVEAWAVDHGVHFYDDLREAG